jgi:hypothetical protein
VPRSLTHWIAELGAGSAERAPIAAALPGAVDDPALLERSAELLARSELAGWFLDPSGVASDGVEWLQAQESRLVVSPQLKAERLAALVDRVVEAQFDAAARRRWGRRLEEQARVFIALARDEDARVAVAVARALADPAQPLRRVPFLRALAERSLEVAGDVATGRLSADAASRAPRLPAPPGPSV